MVPWFLTDNGSFSPDTLFPPPDTNQQPPSQTPDTEIALTELYPDLGQLWGLDILPQGEIIATERTGKLYLLDPENQEYQEISNVSSVNSSGQGGLLDVAVSPDFDQDGWIYLTFSAENQNGATTTSLNRAMLDTENLRLTNQETLFQAEPYIDSHNHYGSRVIIDNDYLFMSIGDRGDKDFDKHVAQDTSNTLGSIIRLHHDGSIPEDNPFVGQEGDDRIYSYGHRNVQGLTFHPETNQVWASEHGEQDGDALHQIQAGGNYGWPEAHTGCIYGTEEDIGDMPQERDDIVNPQYVWECSSGGFPPAGITFYQGDRQDWKGDLLVAGLGSEYLARFTFTDQGLVEQKPLLADQGWRVRDVIFHDQDNALYAAVEGGSPSLVRIR